MKVLHNNSDTIGVFTSLVCSIHCFATPILWVCWLFFVSVILNEMIELTRIPELFSYVSAFSLAFVHVYNLKYCQCQEECCND